MLKLVQDRSQHQEGSDNTIEEPDLITLDELARQGARWMIQAALEEEVAAYIQKFKNLRDHNGRRLVVRNGHAKPRDIQVGSGSIQIKAPRVNDKRIDEQGKRSKFSSHLLPPYMRRSPKVAEVIPVLYLRGLSTGDFKPALKVLLGEKAKGLSSTNIARLTSVWEDEYKSFKKASLAEKDYVYIWADGIHFNIRLEEDRLCTLVIVGVRPDGTKELVALEDGYRESEESWKEVLRSLKKRGMRAPALAIADGALGFWGALREVWPKTREQRDWCHKMRNVKDKLPKRLHDQAKQDLRGIMYSDTKGQAEERLDALVKSYRDRYPKAAECLEKDREALLAFFDFPKEHWVHLRTSNVIESSFATVRLRQRVTKGAGNRMKGLTMAFKLMDMAQDRWRKLNGSKLLPLVRAGVKFIDGVQKERGPAKEEGQQAA